MWTPKQGTPGSAGYDLSAGEDVTLLPFKPALVKLGFSAAIPSGYTIMIVPRSGNALKKGWLIPNSPGIVDESYRGEYGVLLTWIPEPGITGYLHVSKGDRIAQAVLVKYETQEWVETNELDQTERGEGGFGSTGTRA